VLIRREVSNTSRWAKHEYVAARQGKWRARQGIAGPSKEPRLSMRTDSQGCESVRTYVFPKLSKFLLGSPPPGASPVGLNLLPHKRFRSPAATAIRNKPHQLRIR
jgi:hypothetical protein